MNQGKEFIRKGSVDWETVLIIKAELKASERMTSSEGGEFSKDGAEHKFLQKEV